MKFETFLDRIGLVESFKELKSVPMEVFYKGKRQDDVPFEKISLTSKSLTELMPILSEITDIEDKKDLSVKLRMGEDVVNLILFNKYSIASQKLMLFDH